MRRLLWLPGVLVLAGAVSAQAAPNQAATSPAATVAAPTPGIQAQANQTPASQTPALPAPAAPAGSPAAPAGAPEPQRTTASFAEWTLRCVRPEKAPASCEVGQTLFNNGNPFAQTVLGRTTRTEPLHLAIVVPVNVTLQAEPRLLGAESESGFAPLNLSWRRCAGQVCIADVSLTDDQIRRLRGRTENARILFTDAVGREVSMPFGPKGLSQALDALAKEEQR